MENSLTAREGILEVCDRGVPLLLAFLIFSLASLLSFAFSESFGDATGVTEAEASFFTEDAATVGFIS